MRLPAGYDEIHVGKARVLVWQGAREWAHRTLEEFGCLDAWAAGVSDRRALSGRGTVWSVPAGGAGPDARARWVVRRYLRGGAMATILHDTYLRVGPTRPLRELGASVAARARGVPVPAVVMGAVYPAGPFRYRAELVTELVPDARDLAEVLFEPSAPGTPAEGTDGRRAALRAGGRLAARAGAAGVRHPDLNAKNVVIGAASLDDPGAEPEAWMVDLDRCRVRHTPRPEVDTDAMLARLERSLSKLEQAAGQRLAPGEWTALRRGAEDRGATLDHDPDADSPGAHT